MECRYGFELEEEKEPPFSEGHKVFLDAGVVSSGSVQHLIAPVVLDTM